MTVRALTQSVISTQDGVRITIHTVPNAKETAIILEPDGNIMMRVHAPPVKGKANREIVKWLSKKLRRPSSQIRIVAGTRSNLKTVEIGGMDGKSFLEAIGQKTAVSS
ncbi:DUF167 domain-containing protein [Candidatus Bathyarchaeota archaeon]|nr:DUF167 domain-containing protein [Candidatus Bathyarchaeota archaeon]